jgi:hypothetical protein
MPARLLTDELCPASSAPPPASPSCSGPEPVSILVSTEDRLRRPVPPRAVDQSFEPRGVKRGQVGVQADQGVESGQSLTVAERKLCGHIGWVEVQEHAGVILGHRDEALVGDPERRHAEMRLLLYLGKGKGDTSDILQGGHDRHSAKGCYRPRRGRAGAAAQRLTARLGQVRGAVDQYARPADPVKQR